VALVQWRGIPLCAALLVASRIAAAAQPSAPSHLTVPDLLRDLSATGVDVLYSSDLVPEGLGVSTPLHGSDPFSRAVEALASQGLELRKTAPGHFIVTRAARAPKAANAGVTAPPAAPASPATAELEEMAVFASRYGFTGTALGEPYTVADSDIAQYPGASDDALRALRTTPGIATNVSSQPYIRGAFLDDVLVQFDGISLADPFHFKNFQSLISAIDPNAIDRMSVYTGGFPVEFGTRSAGVIDLAPRSIDSGSDYQIGASRETADVSTVGRAERWPIEWLFTFRHSTDGAQLMPIDASFGSPLFYDSVGRVRWQANAASALTLGWLLSDDQAHVGGEPSEEKSQAKSRNLNAWVAWDWAPSGEVHGRTSVTTTEEHLERDGTLILPSVAIGQLSDQRAVSGGTLRTDWVIVPSEMTTINAGAEIGQQTAQLNFASHETFSDIVVSAFDTPPVVSINSNQEPRWLTQSVYASMRWHWPSFEAEAGARADREDYIGYGAHVQGSPRFNARYDPAPSWHLYGSWGEFTQAQRPDEWRSQENQTAPDPASRATHLIGGATYDRADAIRWRLEAYRNHWTSISPYFDNSLNSVSLVPELEPDRVRIAPNDAETAGVELSARRSFGSTLEGWSTYAVSRTTDDRNGGDVPRSWDQTHAASLGLAWQYQRTAASAALDWHSGWPRTPVVLIAATPPTVPRMVVGPRNSGRWPDYFSANVRLARTLSLAHGELSLWIDATNITDRANECCNQFGSMDQTPLQTLLRTVNWRPREINVGFSWRLHQN
jgi:hypothetical protein